MTQTNTTKATKTERLLKFLQTGNDITVGQAKTRFGISNLSATVSALRNQGYAIYSNTKNGGTLRTYRLGTPTRSVVSTGHRTQNFLRQVLSGQKINGNSDVAVGVIVDGRLIAADGISRFL